MSCSLLLLTISLEMFTISSSIVEENPLRWYHIAKRWQEPSDAQLNIKKLMKKKKANEAMLLVVCVNDANKYIDF